MVVRQYKAKGRVTDTLLPVVALDDAVGLVLFAVSFGVAKAMMVGNIDPVSIIVEPILEVVLSLALGLVVGLIFTYSERFFHSRSKRLSMSVAFVLLTVAISMIDTIKIFGVHLAFSPLLACMMLGTTFCNICDFSAELMDRLDRWTGPLYILFFVLSGAELELSVFSEWTVVLIGVVYIIARSAGKYYGADISCHMTHQPKPIADNLGITLLPQAGVALGMAITASTLPGGSFTRNVVLFAVLIYELIGPSLTKRSLLAVGEIRPEGRTSARRHNQPKHHYSLHFGKHHD
jgi:NhaP-type Na+/H+ or K+/H+ antiporter